MKKFFLLTIISATSTIWTTPRLTIPSFEPKNEDIFSADFLRKKETVVSKTFLLNRKRIGRELTNTRTLESLVFTLIEQGRTYTLMLDHNSCDHSILDQEKVVERYSLVGLKCNNCQDLWNDCETTTLQEERKIRMLDLINTIKTFSVDVKDNKINLS